MADPQSDVLQTVILILKRHIQGAKVFRRGQDNDISYPQLVVGMNNATSLTEYRNAHSRTQTVAIDVYTSDHDSRTCFELTNQVIEVMRQLSVFMHYRGTMQDWSANTMMDTSTGKTLQRTAILCTYKLIEKRV